MQRDKINILKAEYYKLEVEGREHNSDIRAQLAVAKEQLANYESMEKEIDQAIGGIA